MVNSPLVVIDDFDIGCIAAGEFEADTPLDIDTDAVLPQAVALQGFKEIAGGKFKVFQLCSVMKHGKFSLGHSPDIDETRHGFAVIKALGLLASERLDHDVCKRITSFIKRQAFLRNGGEGGSTKKPAAAGFVPLWMVWLYCLESAHEQASYG
jgi:hypothetical protein